MKTCNHCGEEKEEDDFNWKNRAAGLRQSYCRECKKFHQKKYYAENKQSYTAKIYETRAKRFSESREKAKQYLLTHPCVDCGNADIRVLEFDHVTGVKVNEVTRLIHEGARWKRVEEEIAKCEIRCANCHTIRTWPNRWD